MRESMENQRAKAWILQPTKDYFSFLLEGIRQIVCFLLTFQGLWRVDFVIFRILYEWYSKFVLSLRESHELLNEDLVVLYACWNHWYMWQKGRNIVLHIEVLDYCRRFGHVVIIQIVRLRLLCMWSKYIRKTSSFDTICSVRFIRYKKVFKRISFNPISVFSFFHSFNKVL